MITVVVVVLWLFVFSILAGLQCGTHFSALWDGTYTQYCTISFPFLYGLAVSDFLLDVWILVLPIPRVAQLNASLSKKLAIIGVFLLACVGVGFSIARMATYIDIENGGALYFAYHDEEGKPSTTLLLVLMILRGSHFELAGQILIGLIQQKPLPGPSFSRCWKPVYRSWPSIFLRFGFSSIPLHRKRSFAVFAA